MAVGVKPGALIDKGGNQMFAYVVDPSTFAGVTLTVGTYLFNLSFIGSSNIEQQTDEQETEYEDGNKVSIGWTYTIILETQLKQSDKELIDFLADTVKGQTFLMGKYTGYVNAKYQWFYSLMKIKPAFKVTRPGGADSMRCDAKSVQINTAVTFSAATMASIGALLSLSNYPTATMTVSTSKRFEFVEV